MRDDMQVTDAQICTSWESRLLTSLSFAIDAQATFWSAMNAISTFAAVVVALALPVGGAWLAGRRRRKHALQYIGALGSELIWVDEKAEVVIQKARRELAKPRGHIGHGLSIGWSVEDDALEAFDKLAAISFPTYTLAAPALADGPGDIGEIVASGYGRLYRAKVELDSLRSRLQGSQPRPEDLKGYDRVAGAALAAARVTYRQLGAFARLPVPKHWEPSA